MVGQELGSRLEGQELELEVEAAREWVALLGLE